MAIRSVDADAIFAEFRDTYIATCTDIGDITTLGNTFTATPTDLVEACNKTPSIGFAVAICAALG